MLKEYEPERSDTGRRICNERMQDYILGINNNIFTDTFILPYMNKLQKTWLRINLKRTLNKNFTREYYINFIEDLKMRFDFIDFHSEAKRGILLRHDIDNDLDMAVKMAEIEAGMDKNLNRAMFEHGDPQLVQSTYFILNTARYWDSLELGSALRYISNLGHEIGWHNNAITEHLKTGKSIEACVREPLSRLRCEDLLITGSAAHGDRLCKTFRYHNYNVFGFKSKGWEFWDLAPLNMAKFGLFYEAYHVPYHFWLADCHEGWNGSIRSIREWSSSERHQILIHPQNWRL
jgi:hypothetical protein